MQKTPRRNHEIRRWHPPAAHLAAKPPALRGRNHQIGSISWLTSSRFEALAQCPFRGKMPGWVGGSDQLAIGQLGKKEAARPIIPAGKTQ
jgi:hypothetical protein